MIGQMHIECIVEFSRDHRRFYIMAWDIYTNRYYTIELYHKQANKLFNSCDNKLEKLMKMLDFKHGKMYIRHQDVLMSFEKSQPPKHYEKPNWSSNSFYKQPKKQMNFTLCENSK